MIRKFLLERISWILFFMFTMIFVLFVGYIDPATSMTSILYYIYLCLFFFIIFLFLRYKKESRYYQSLLNKEDALELSSLQKPDGPFEEIVDNTIREQTARLQSLVSVNQTELEQEKDDLLSWIHDVKTPMTAMKLMIDRTTDHELKANLTYEWLRIHFLLDQQLHRKRLSFIENDLYIENLSLPSMIRAELRTLQAWCMQKGIGFDLDLNVTEVLSDGKWLSFILRQFLTNAVKYSESNDIIIQSFKEEKHIVISVQDFGRGIAEEDLPRLFDSGFTSTRDHQHSASTGMGLYLAKKAADGLHASIKVTSILGTGSTFKLILPERNTINRISAK